MEKYVGEYLIERDIHLRPAVDIGNEVVEFVHTYGMKIWIGDYFHSEISPIAIMLECGKAFKENNGLIRITTSGEYSLEELKLTADEIGKRFMKSKSKHL